MRKMKQTAKILLLSSLAFFSGHRAAQGQSNAALHISGIDISRSEGKLNMKMTVSPSRYHLPTNSRLTVTPVVRDVETSDSVAFPSFTVAGKNSWYVSLRNGRTDALRSGKGEDLVYSVSTPWQDWMETSRVDFDIERTGCCGAPSEPKKEMPVADLDWTPREYPAVFSYEPPLARQAKTRMLSGMAYINFPVNRTEIYPDYMVNPRELRKILNTIDSVRSNPDVTVRSIRLIGFASPEGPYSNNVRLAAGRTEALKEYVRKQYDFPAHTFRTSSVPEDWAGLRDSVAAGYLPDRQSILNLIDDNSIPIERKNDELRRRYPRDYAWLLKNVYPSLRHTNYEITYDIREYTDVEEIKRVLKTRPQDLSLNEFYLAAQSYGEGSEEYDEVWATAVRMYPQDEVANLNAANASMHRGSLAEAERFLKNAGTSANADYARATLLALKKDYPAARSLYEKALRGGCGKAQAGINSIDRLTDRGQQNVTYYE